MVENKERSEKRKEKTDNMGIKQHEVKIYILLLISRDDRWDRGTKKKSQNGKHICKEKKEIIASSRRDHNIIKIMEKMRLMLQKKEAIVN